MFRLAQFDANFPSLTAMLGNYHLINNRNLIIALSVLSKAFLNLKLSNPNQTKL